MKSKQTRGGKNSRIRSLEIRNVVNSIVVWIVYHNVNIRRLAICNEVKNAIGIVDRNVDFWYSILRNFT